MWVSPIPPHGNASVPIEASPSALNAETCEFCQSPDTVTGLCCESSPQLANRLNNRSRAGSKRGTAGGLASVIEVCRQLAPAAEDLGIIVTLENHAGNVLEQPEDYEEIFSAIDSPNLGMCLDTGHFEGVGVDLHEVVDKFDQKILHADLKDCRERGKGHDTVPFGEGVTDFDAFLQHLFSKDYSGYLVIEQAWREPKGDWKGDLGKAREQFLPYTSSAPSH